MTRDRLVLLTSEGLKPWKPETEAAARECLDEVIREYEQVLVFGLKRSTEHHWCPATSYIYMHRLSRTNREEFFGALTRTLHKILLEDPDEEGESG